MSYWDDYRQQNLDSLLYPLIKFQDYIDDDNKEYFDEMKSYSAENLFPYFKDVGRC